MDQCRNAVRAIFGRTAYLKHYCNVNGCGDLNADTATDDFLERARSQDISPVFLFDPAWFRSKYRVTGTNAFLSYLSNPDQRLAWPSPLFAPRWYARRHGLYRSARHPFDHYLLADREQSPHPLLDTDYLKRQSLWWRYPDAVAFEFMVDPSKHRLKPHPLFDSGWYLNTQDDIAGANINPLQHYLYQGHHENRSPNRLFSIPWYRDTYLNSFTTQHASRFAPLSHYVCRGAANGCVPMPMADALASPAKQITEHGPELLIECLEQQRPLYQALKVLPRIPFHHVQKYMNGTTTTHNPFFVPEHMLYLRRQHLALLFSAKCASATIVYWWLSQVGLLPFVMRFSRWSHDGLNVYRLSEEYLADALTFDPAKAAICKFVRNPLARTVSSFRHFMLIPGTFGMAVDSGKQTMSFVEFLHRLHDTNYINRDLHFRPQITEAEKSGKLSPTIVKIECGVREQLAELERRHNLPPVNLDAAADIRLELQRHPLESRARISVGPRDEIRFGQMAKTRDLLTPETVAMIHDLYRDDFEAYGYRPEI